ncbi:MAG: DUF3108 domain-containing protein [Nitrospina sp.]|jgi:hypothetical protein|nr:DUF3108 domain-containing protein [Nitrospina sp.]MBT5631782.1 DUF3108 domain-containing protein [Nitrospina sp.]
MSFKLPKLPLFLIIIIVSLISSSFVPTAYALDAKSAKPIAIGKYDNFLPEGKITRFIGETLYYDISFLWFKNAASAKVSFFEENGNFFSVLEASTKGFVGFFTSYRKHFYKTEFEVIDNGKKLRPKTFLRQVVIGNQVEGTQHHFDYAKRLHTWEKQLNGEQVETEQEEIPFDEAFNDILTTFYNVRNGVYGSLRNGKKFVIRTIPEKGHDKISVHILPEQDQERIRIEEGRQKRDEMLINVKVPKEIFKTQTGELMFWSSSHNIPVETTVKDYILLGDLHARFTHREANH